MTVVLLLLLIAFLLLVVRQQGATRAVTQADQTGIAATTTFSPAAVATSMPTPVPTSSPLVALVSAVGTDATSTSVAPPTPTDVPATATIAPPTRTAPPTSTVEAPTATEAPPTATEVPPTAAPSEPTARLEGRPTATAAVAAFHEPTATHTSTARPGAPAHPSATPERATTTSTTNTAATIEAVQVSRSQISAGEGQAVVVVAPPGTAIAVSVTYPSRTVQSFRGTAGTNGVYRAQFTIPANAGSGPAQVRVAVTGASRSAVFSVS